MIWVRRVLAVIGGIMVSSLLVFIIELPKHILYPPPEGVTTTDPSYIASLPLPAFLILLAGYLIGTFGGGWVAAVIAGEHPALFASIIAGVMLALTAVMLYWIEGHPMWFPYVALLGIPIMGVLAGSLVPQRGKAATKEAKPKQQD